MSLQVLNCEDLEPRFRELPGCKELVREIQTTNELRFSTRDLSDRMELTLERAVALLLKRYGHEHLLSVIYTSLKEILVNATRANAKEAWFREHGLDINDTAQFQQGMGIIKGEINESWIRKYGAMADEMGLTVDIYILHSEDGIRIEVRNVALKPEEEARIRAKLSEAMKYDDLMAFYMANADDTEGEGIGLAMILVLLKGESIDPNLFRMGVVEERTLSRLEIPLSESFVSVRGSDPAGRIASM